MTQKYYDIRQVSLIYSKESNKVPALMVSLKQQSTNDFGKASQILCKYLILSLLSFFRKYFVVGI